MRKSGNNLRLGMVRGRRWETCIKRAKPRGVTCLPVLAACLLIAGTIRSTAGQSHGTRLESYLKQLGYEPVKFEPDRRNRPLVEGRIGADKKRTFLVDTGCWNLTLLDKESAAGLKTLGQLGVILEDSLWGRLTNQSIVLIDKLVLGRAQFLNQPARIADLELDYIRNGRDGILGADFVFRNWCLIDCGGRTLYVRRSKPTDEQIGALAESLRRSAFVEVPLRADPGLIADISINGQSVQFIVDTGAPFTALDESQLTPLGLSTVKQTAPSTGTLIPAEETGRAVGSGKIGAHRLRATTVKTLCIGQKELKDVHLGVVDLKAWGLLKAGSPGEHLVGLLGIDILQGQGALIDLAGEKLWFYPR